MRWMTVLAALCLACSPEPEISPFEGPGFDSEANALKSAKDSPYVVALTWLQVKNAPGPGGRFGEHANAAGTSLFEEGLEGFVGVSFRNIGRLNWWTMTVWEDEASMAAWVYSGVHLEAIEAFPDVAANARKAVVERDADEVPMDWDEALSILDAQEDYVYRFTAP